MDLVIVESPAKAKTINKYLGSGYEVLASFGHVRDLPSKDGSVEPDADFAMNWEVDAKSAKRVADLVRAAKGASRVILATDPDREGEAISWHILELLRQKKAVKGEVQRVTFNAITKSAVLEAMAKPRQIDQALVDAYLARRALDYLVGFGLSPVLWRKLPGARSAGRVQSVSLRLVCDREAEIEAFRPREYWTLVAHLLTPKGEAFEARLTTADGRKLGRLDVPNEAEALALKASLEAGRYAVANVESKPAKRNPAPPFTTSTLQQEASRKLGMSPARSMQVAQRLYEGIEIGGETTGLITYMRTDGVDIAPEAVQALRRLIANEHGDRYLPDKPRHYQVKAKNAQEAHEAVRPTDPQRTPKAVARYLEPEALKLYELIWKRAVASQMESAELERTAVDIEAQCGERRLELRATGQVVRFDGFLALYQEGRDDEEEEGGRLPLMRRGEALSKERVAATQSFTEPPPRYSEASLVKRMEELGIGRPSTYAATLAVLQDREYVRLEKKRLHAEDKGLLVTAFLHNFFERYVSYDFTAMLEQRLDAISDEREDWRAVLRDFWRDFSAAVEGTKELRVTQVLDTLNEVLGPHVFPVRTEGADPRECPRCRVGRLSLKLGKGGPFVGCANYPECRYTRPLGGGAEGDGAGAEGEEPGQRRLGEDPVSGLIVTLRDGRFGPYLQLGDGEKPKRSSLPKGLLPRDVDLPTALALLALPKEVARHPTSGEPVLAGIGRYGPYVQHGKTYANLAPDDDVLTIGGNRAIDLVVAKEEGRGGSRFGRPAPAGRALGDHPDGGPITVREGRFGPYVNHGSLNANVPKGLAPDAVTLEQAVDLLRAREAAGGGKPARGRAKPAAKKTAAKKPAAKAKAAPATAALGTDPDDIGAPLEAKKAVTKKAAAKKPAARKAPAKAGAAKAATAKPAASKPAARKRAPAAAEG